MFEFQPSETQEMMREGARQYADRILAPRATALDHEGGFPEDSLRQAADLGLLGINVPEAYGGVEAGAVSYALSVMELARTCAATTVAMTVSNMVAEVICAFGTEAQRESHVTRLCSGEYVVGGFALSEAGAGSDPSRMLTKATRTDKGWCITGNKLWITSGTHAGLFVVWARTSDAPGARGLSAFLVSGDAPGLVRGKPEEKMGQHGSTTTPLELHEVEVGEDGLLGKEGEGFRIAMMALDGGRIGIASLASGVARGAHEFALDYAQERTQFGAPIMNYQAIQWMLADNATELDAMQLMTLNAAWLKDQGKPFTREASMAKLYASERGFDICNRSLQVLGGYGYTREYPVERALRDIRVTSIYEGTSQIQRIVISRDIARRFGDRS